MVRRILAVKAMGLALIALVLLPGASFAQFLDRWHEWGHGYGYGRSGFDIGQPGSAFSSPSWPSYYPAMPSQSYSGPPIVILNVYPPPAGYPAFYPPATNPAERAYIRVHVPGGAAVSFDGSPTQQTGTDRLFTSPPLASGGVYTYNVSARWTANGKEHEETRTVRVIPGQTVAVAFAP